MTNEDKIALNQLASMLKTGELHGGTITQRSQFVVAIERVITTPTKIDTMDLFMLDVKSNEFIKKYRAELGLETPNNRIDTGDLKMIIIALADMGFNVVKQ